MKFSVVSTFSGCGGSSLGYKMAGGKVLLAVEHDANAVETYRTNFPDTKVYHGDIEKITVDQILHTTGLNRGELDIFDGSPPCQGFSTAGKRVMDDDRNHLFRQYIRLLQGLHPKAFVMENVSGMVKGNMKFLFVEILRELKASGYNVSARLLNAKYFGVPQSRERLIFIGYRSDFNRSPSHPVGNSNIITASEALKGVKISRIEHKMLIEAGKKYSVYEHWDKMKPGEQVSKILGPSLGFSGIKLNPNKPSPTIMKNEGCISRYGFMHWAEKRRFTVSEYKRLSSFPDNFIFKGGWSSSVMRIGNSVPPFLMKAVAEHIYTDFLSVINR